MLYCITTKTSVRIQITFASNVVGMNSGMPHYLSTRCGNLSPHHWLSSLPIHILCLGPNSGYWASMCFFFFFINSLKSVRVRICIFETKSCSFRLIFAVSSGLVYYLLRYT